MSDCLKEIIKKSYDTKYDKEKISDLEFFIFVVSVCIFAKRGASEYKKGE